MTDTELACILFKNPHLREALRQMMDEENARQRAGRALRAFGDSPPMVAPLISVRDKDGRDVPVPAFPWDESWGDNVQRWLASLNTGDTP